MYFIVKKCYIFICTVYVLSVCLTVSSVFLTRHFYRNFSLGIIKVSVGEEEPKIMRNEKVRVWQNRMWKHTQ